MSLDRAVMAFAGVMILISVALIHSFRLGGGC